MHKLAMLSTMSCVAFLLLPACESKKPTLLEEGEMTLSISSPAFQDGEGIPAKYTCQGQDISPLVENYGLGSGDILWLKDNNLDLQEGSEDMENLKALEDRGVEVHLHDEPKR